MGVLVNSDSSAVATGRRKRRKEPRDGSREEERALGNVKGKSFKDNKKNVSVLCAFSKAKSGGSVSKQPSKNYILQKNAIPRERERERDCVPVSGRQGRGKESDEELEESGNVPAVSGGPYPPLVLHSSPHSQAP